MLKTFEGYRERLKDIKVPADATRVQASLYRIAVAYAEHFTDTKYDGLVTDLREATNVNEVNLTVLALIEYVATKSQ